MGKIWTLQDAKNEFSAVVEAAQRGELQHVTKRGVEAVVVVSAEEYERLSKLRPRPKPKKTFVEHILSAPKLPEGMEDIFDDRHIYPSEYRDIDLDDAPLVYFGCSSSRPSGEAASSRDSAATSQPPRLDPG